MPDQSNNVKRYFDHTFIQRLPDERRYAVQVIFDTFFEMDRSYSTDDEKVLNFESYEDAVIYLQVFCAYINIEVDLSSLSLNEANATTIQKIINIFTKMRKEIPVIEYQPEDYSAAFTRDFYNELPDDPYIAAEIICDKFFEMNWHFLTGPEKLQNYDIYVAALKCLNMVILRMEIKSRFMGFSEDNETNIQRIIRFFMEVKEELYNRSRVSRFR